MTAQVLFAIHVFCVTLSASGFFVRGIWMLNDSPLLHVRWVRVTPHVVDTVLLVSAIALMGTLSLSPMSAPWLLAKIAALILYIVLGLIALRLGKSRAVRMVSWIAALMTFAYIVAVALTKSPSLGFA